MSLASDNRLIELRNDVKALQQTLLTSELARRRAWYQQTVYPWYQSIIFEEFRTQGSSQSKSWVIRDPKWVKRKDRMRILHPEKYPGGDRPAILTGKLLGSLSGLTDPEFEGTTIGANQHHFKAIDDKLEITTDLIYANRIDEIYDLTTLSESTIEELEGMIAEYIGSLTE